MISLPPARSAAAFTGFASNPEDSLAAGHEQS